MGTWRTGRVVPPGSRWPWVLRYYHGMRPEQWEAMFREQGGNCYLCDRPLPANRSKVVIDHDHACCKSGPATQSYSCSYCRRGLACGKCNTAIGLVDEDPQRLRVMADNLERAQALTSALMVTKPQQRDLFEEGAAG